MQTAVLKIGIDPTIDLGPVTLAWHELTIAIGILLGGFATVGAWLRTGSAGRRAIGRQVAPPAPTSYAL